jgi:type VI secretion system secreted protein VgrG
MTTAHLVALDLPGLPSSARALAFRAEESLSRPYLLEAFAAVPVDDADAEVTLDGDGSVTLLRDDGSPRTTFAGVVTASELVAVRASTAVLRVELRPALWKLSLSAHSRVWVDKPFPDILSAVLRENGVTRFRLALKARYAPLPHVCQYRESDLDFLSRWMEREGIYYFFRHEAGGEEVVFTDHATHHEPSPADPVQFGAAAGDTTAAEKMHSFFRRVEARSKESRLKDYDYLQPALDLSAKEAVLEGLSGPMSHFGDNLLTQRDARSRARVRAEEEGAGTAVFHGHGRAFELRTGFTFELVGHPAPEHDGQYLATQLVHRAINDVGSEGLHKLIDPQRAWSRPGASAYEVFVAAIPKKVQFRAERLTPAPRVVGLERAVVDGPASSEYAQIDAHGRYHVRAMFDEATRRDGQNSMWVRMVQPHAGEPEGFHFPLRKGTEVLLGFVEGDPDRPEIVGVVPNPDTPSPVTRSNATQNVIMTGGRNRVEIEDTDGSQYVQVYSPPQNSSLHLGAHNGPYHHGHNFTLSTDGNALFHTGGVRDITVGAVQTEDVKGDLTEHYKSNQTTTVDSNFTETINGSATQTINGGETRTVHAGHTETITGGETRTVSPSQLETVTGSVTRTINGDLTETVGAATERTITGSQDDTVGGARTVTALGGITLETPGALDVTAQGPTLLVGIGGVKVTAPGGVTNVDGFWDKLGGFEGKGYAFKIGYTSLKLDVAALIICAYKWKIEHYTFKAERTGMVAACCGNEAEEHGVEAETGVAHQEVNGATTAA